MRTYTLCDGRDIVLSKVTSVGKVQEGRHEREWRLFIILGADVVEVNTLDDNSLTREALQTERVAVLKAIETR